METSIFNDRYGATYASVKGKNVFISHETKIDLA
jgi:hypothetical protein